MDTELVTPAQHGDRFERPLIEALGEDEWARERAAGATLTLEQAIELARTLAATPPETTPHSA